MSRESSLLSLVGTLCLVVLFVLAAAGSAGAQDEYRPQKGTIAGTVQGIEEDDEGNPRRVYIQDDNLGPILVVDDEKGRELLKLVGSQVEATGMLGHTGESTVEGYDLQIQIESYEVLD